MSFAPRSRIREALAQGLRHKVLFIACTAHLVVSAGVAIEASVAVGLGWLFIGAVGFVLLSEASSTRSTHLTDAAASETLAQGMKLADAGQHEKAILMFDSLLSAGALAGRVNQETIRQALVSKERSMSLIAQSSEAKAALLQSMNELDTFVHELRPRANRKVADEAEAPDLDQAS